MTKIIGVVSGGYTSERNISKNSGSVVFDALKHSPYRCFHIDIAPKQWTVADDNGTTYPLQRGDFSFSNGEETFHFDGIINMIHGAPGENGQLAGYLEMLSIPQSSCDSAMAALTFDKRNCLAVASAWGIPTAKRVAINQGDLVDQTNIIAQVGLPCFVKANRAGSSFGVYKVNAAEELLPAIEKAFKEDHQILIEQALIGKEVTIGVYQQHEKTSVLPITEIISENDFFDYQAKYEGKSQEITPARLSPEEQEQVTKYAVFLYEQLGLKGITRSEYIFHKGIPHLLEINTIPGMTEASIIPQQAAVAGISLPQLMEEVVETMLAKKT